MRELQKNLYKRANATTKRGKPPTVTSVTAQVNKILHSRSAPLKTLISAEMKEVNGSVYLEYAIDHEALDKYKEEHMGKHILFTDRNDWSTEEIVTAYRGQSHIEEAFKRMKDPHFLSWRPQYHWTDQKIMVHAFYCVLAITITALARRKACQSGLDISIPKMLDELAGIKEVVHIYPQEAKQKDCLTLTKCSELQQQLMTIMKIGRL